MAATKEAPKIYEASAEYARIQRTQMGPRNLPPDVAARMRSRGVQAEIGPATATDPAFIALAARWGNLTAQDKMREGGALDSVEDVLALMGIERDSKVLQFLLERKIELEMTPVE
jgi:hypothetical protein